MRNMTIVMWVIITLFTTCSVFSGRKPLEAMLPSKQCIYDAFFARQVNTSFLTRKSSCVNAKGIPTAAYQLLPELGYPSPPLGYPLPGPTGRGVPEVGYPHQGTPGQVWQGVPKVGYPPSWGDLAWVPPYVWTERRMDGLTDTCQNITFPRTP